MPTNAAWVIWGAAWLLACLPAAGSESVLAVMRSCAAQADESARLQCYDRGVAQFKGADAGAGNDTTCSNIGVSRPVVSAKSPPANPAGPVPGVSSGAGTNTPPGTNTQAGGDTERFGLTSSEVLRKESKGERPGALKKMTAKIVTLAHRTGGTLVLHLDNGQIWEQTEEGPDLHIAAGDAVEIDRGVLGAYWLSPVSRHLAVKVRRTQ